MIGGEIFGQDGLAEEDLEKGRKSRCLVELPLNNVERTPTRASVFYAEFNTVNICSESLRMQ